MRGVLKALAENLRIRGRLDVREAFIDASFAPAKKGDRRSAKRNVVRERRSWQGHPQAGRMCRFFQAQAGYLAEPKEIGSGTA